MLLASLGVQDTALDIAILLIFFLWFIFVRLIIWMLMLPSEMECWPSLPEAPVRVVALYQPWQAARRGRNTYGPPTRSRYPQQQVQPRGGLP